LARSGYASTAISRSDLTIDSALLVRWRLALGDNVAKEEDDEAAEWAVGDERRCGCCESDDDEDSEERPIVEQEVGGGGRSTSLAEEEESWKASEFDLFLLAALGVGVVDCAGLEHFEEDQRWSSSESSSDTCPVSAGVYWCSSSSSSSSGSSVISIPSSSAPSLPREEVDCDASFSAPPSPTSSSSSITKTVVEDGDDEL
jgi:hypothetical protein